MQCQMSVGFSQNTLFRKPFLTKSFLEKISPCNATTWAVPLTVFSDGVNRVRPTTIFKGKGLWISTKEKVWQTRGVTCQEKDQCDENIMKEWVNTEWSSLSTNPRKYKKIFIPDVYRDQQTDYVKTLLTKKMTSLCNIPPGCTSLVQAADVTINKPFRDEVRRLFEDHLDKHLELYVEGKLSASERRILMTKWVGQAGRKLVEWKSRS